MPSRGDGVFYCYTDAVTAASTQHNNTLTLAYAVTCTATATAITVAAVEPAQCMCVSGLGMQNGAWLDVCARSASIMRHASCARKHPTP